jgi:hypothetical protein
MKANLPSDPDGKNDERTAWAKTALLAFMAETGTDLEDVLCDLLCDLMRLSDRVPFDFEAALIHAKDHSYWKQRAETPAWFHACFTTRGAWRRWTPDACGRVRMGRARNGLASQRRVHGSNDDNRSHWYGYASESVSALCRKYLRCPGG